MSGLIVQILIVCALIFVGLKYFKVSLSLILFSFSLWSLTYYFTFPAALSDLKTNYIAVANLKGDVNNLKLRAWDLDKKLLNKNFSSKLEARKWLENRTNALALVMGNSEWVDLLLRKKYNFLDNLISRTDLLKNKDLIIEDKKTNLKLIFLPQEVRTSLSPLELSSGLIKNLMKALEQKEFKTIKEEINYRKSYAKKAREIYGPWKSGIPRALAFFLEANFLTLEKLIKTDSVSCKQIHKTYRAAASLAKGSNFSALIYNNAAIAKKICAEKSKNLFDLALEVAKIKQVKRVITENLSN